jgi:hypothetical protein
MMIVTSIESAVTYIFTFVGPKVIFWGLVQVKKREYPKPVIQDHAQGQPYQTQHMLRTTKIYIHFSEPLNIYFHTRNE